MKTTYKIALLIVAIIVGFMYYGCESNPCDPVEEENIVKEGNNNICINMMYYDNGVLKLFKDNAHAIHIVQQGKEWFFIIEKPEKDTLLKININQIEVLLTDGKGAYNCE